MITLTSKGDFKTTTKWLERIANRFDLSILDKYGAKGVAALSDATPIDTGTTANSWYYEISSNMNKGWARITFCNSNVNKGVPIAIILQYGHATGNGGYVQGRDYINPAIQPIFDEMAEDVWKEVTRT